MATERAKKKAIEGEEHMRKGDKCLETSWFKLKLKPDYDGAAQAFTTAANCFRAGKAYEKAKGAFLKAADAQLQCRAIFHSAKALELAGQMAKELGNIREATDLMGNAAYRYRENGTVDTASQVFEKTARLLEGINVDKAIRFYLEGVDILETEDRNRQAVEMLGKAVKLLVSKRSFDECIETMKRQIEMYGTIGNTGQIYRATVGLIVVHLARHDKVAADNTFADAISVPGFSDSDESAAIEDLLDAYEKSDVEEMRKVTSKAMFTYMDNELAKLARSLHPEEELRAAPHSRRTNTGGPQATIASESAARDELFSVNAKEKKENIEVDDEGEDAETMETGGSQEDAAPKEGNEMPRESEVDPKGDEDDDDDDDENGLR